MDTLIDGRMNEQMDKSRLKMMNLRHEWIYGLRIQQIDRPVDGWIDRQTDRQITKKQPGY